MLGVCTEIFCEVKEKAKCASHKADYCDGKMKCCPEGSTCAKRGSYPTCVDDLDVPQEAVPCEIEECPADCETFFDGCNMCKCSEGKKIGCTYKLCLENEEPKCMDDEKEEKKCPMGCTNYYDGCNR